MHKLVAPGAGRRVPVVQVSVAQALVTLAVMLRHCTATTLQAAWRARLLAELARAVRAVAAQVVRARVVRAQVVRARVVRAQVVRARVVRARVVLDRMARRHSAATVQAAQVAEVARRAVAAVPVQARADAVSQALVERMEPMVRALRRAGAARGPAAVPWQAWAVPAEAATRWRASRAVAQQAPVAPAPAGVGRAA
jgi:hypothetical protein